VVLAALTSVLVAGLALDGTGAVGGSAQAAELQGPSEAPAIALSSSWFCAGATVSNGGAAPGELVFSNAGSESVTGSVRLVSHSGRREDLSVTVAAGATSTLEEQFPSAHGGPGAPWVGALVTLYGGTASVSQLVRAPEGVSSQPCASSAATNWYFVDGETLRNATEEISLLNPYPEVAIADLSFTTEYGQEQPVVFEGVVVPPDGLTVLNLGSHLRRRTRIAVSVSVRTGQVVAFQTELVTPPPPGAPLVGSNGGLNPAAPIAGATLTLGSSEPSTSWWWPEGADGGGLTENYVFYNPGGRAATLSLSLISQGAGGGLGSATELTVGPYATATVTTNGQPWALPGIAYAAHLASTNGVPVVAERSLVGSSPSPERGLGVLLGQDQPANGWLLPGSPALAVSEMARAPAAPVPLLPQALLARVSGLVDQAIAGLAAVTMAAQPSGQLWLEALDRGRKTAVVVVGSIVRGRFVALRGTRPLVVPAGERNGMFLPATASGQALVVSSSQAVLVEQDWYGYQPATGMSLSPAVRLG
jgi:Family of unknown function (DUF5719)